MFKLHNILCVLFYFFECLLYVESIPCRGTASYILQFQGEWRNTSSRPAGASFSGLIGCSHNKCYQMWRPGDKASLGVKNVAEKGDPTELSENEIQKHLDEWKTVAERLLSKNNTIEPEGEEILPETRNFKAGFEVDTFRPLVSVIAKIIPSPDLFVGVFDMSLCNVTNGNWIDEKIKVLYPFDAGTADYSTSSINGSVVVPTSPRQNIAEKRDLSISDFERGMGYMRFKLKKKFEPASDVIIDSNNCPNMASLRKVSLLTWMVLVGTTVFIL